MAIFTLFGFYESVVDLSFQLIANNWFSILINDEPVGFFRSTWGVWQGNPISPILFVLMMVFFERGACTLCSSKETIDSFRLEGIKFHI